MERAAGMGKPTAARIRLADQQNRFIESAERGSGKFLKS
jgi:hypothetical protein